MKGSYPPPPRVIKVSLKSPCNKVLATKRKSQEGGEGIHGVILNILYCKKPPEYFYARLSPPNKAFYYKIPSVLQKTSLNSLQNRVFATKCGHTGGYLKNIILPETH